MTKISVYRNRPPNSRMAIKMLTILFTTTVTVLALQQSEQLQDSFLSSSDRDFDKIIESGNPPDPAMGL